MSNPLPRMQMLDGFNEGWIAFDGGSRAEAVYGTTTLQTVLQSLLARS
jgi:NAD(P)H dehydrogenase (quinone)